MVREKIDKRSARPVHAPVRVGSRASQKREERRERQDENSPRARVEPFPPLLSLFNPTTLAPNPSPKPLTIKTLLQSLERTLLRRRTDTGSGLGLDRWTDLVGISSVVSDSVEEFDFLDDFVRGVVGVESDRKNDEEREEGELEVFGFDDLTGVRAEGRSLLWSRESVGRGK